MHRDISVAEVNIDIRRNKLTGISKIFHAEHFPVGTFFQKKADAAFLEEWWAKRAIPDSRPGLNEALALLDISAGDSLITKGLGLSLSDQYWVCPESKKIDWQTVNFFENAFSPDVGNALFGKKPDTINFDFSSPDSTSDGWLQKRWLIADGKRILLKSGSPPFYQEPCNEVIATKLMERLAIPHVKYELVFQDGKPYSICENFITKDTELVSAWLILDRSKEDRNVSNYQHFVKSCKQLGCDKLGITDINSYLDRMLTVDYIVGNTDRHYNNFGMIRNASSLEWVNTAPIFDTGTSLWHNHSAKDIKPANMIESKPFKGNHSEQIKLVKDFSWLNFKALDKFDLECDAILRENTYIDTDRRAVICAALTERIRQIKDMSTKR
jgi:hypothetical protein